MVRRSWFSVYGLEIEYMIVDRETLDVRPLSDRILVDDEGGVVDELTKGAVSWSNELALHVLELKSAQPVVHVAGLVPAFQEAIQSVNRCLEPWHACLLPTGMHPWMNPTTDARLWPHDLGEIYRAFDRVFDCRGHGWTNLQSCHLNLPFANDAEFARLHAAIRLILPLLPALAASSPFQEGQATGRLDQRIEVYRHNADRVPLVTGEVIPEPVDSEAAYQRSILGPLYEQISPWDADGLLQHEWLNARGAIARFDRGSIEIRLLDTQETPAADCAIATFIAEVLQFLVNSEAMEREAVQPVPTEALVSVLNDCVRRGRRATVSHRAYLTALGVSRPSETVGAIWESWLQGLTASRAEQLSTSQSVLERLLKHGALAERILQAWSGDMTSLRQIYRELSHCLERGELFRAD